MITNLFDKGYLFLSMLIKQALQTGSIVDCTNWLQLLIVNKISWSEVSRDWFQEQSKIKEPRWSEEPHGLGW